MIINHIYKLGNNTYIAQNDWYWERFYHFASILDSNKKAWEAVEEEFYEKFQCYRFSTYGAFRQGKYRRFLSNGKAGSQGKLDFNQEE